MCEPVGDELVPDFAGGGSGVKRLLSGNMEKCWLQLRREQSFSIFPGCDEVTGALNKLSRSHEKYHLTDPSQMQAVRDLIDKTL